MIIISRLLFVCLKKNYNAGITFGMGLGILLFCSGLSLSLDISYLHNLFKASEFRKKLPLLQGTWLFLIIIHWICWVVFLFGLATIRLQFSHSSTFYSQVQNDLKIFIAQLVNKVMPFLMKITIFVWIMI